MSRVQPPPQRRFLRKTALAMSMSVVFGPFFVRAEDLSCDPNTSCVRLNDDAIYAGMQQVNTQGSAGTKDDRTGGTPQGAELLDQGAFFNLDSGSGGGTLSTYYGVLTATSTGGSGYEEGDSGAGGGVRLESAGSVKLSVSSGNQVAAVLYAKSVGGSGPTDNSNNDSSGGKGGNGGSISVVTYSGSQYQVAGTATQDMSGIFVASLGGMGGAQNSGIGDQYGGTGGDGQSVTIDNSGSFLFDRASFAINDPRPFRIGEGVLVGLIRGDSEGGGGGKGNGNAGNGGDVTINHHAGTLQLVAAQGDGTQTVYGIRGSSEGAQGYESSDNSDSGGLGGDGGTVTINAYSDIDLQAPGMQGAGIQALSNGGQGGESPDKDHSGGNGGVGKDVTVTVGDMTSNSTTPVTISTQGTTLFGVQATSKGGFGGDGVDSTVLAGQAGGGGFGGNAGNVAVNVGDNATITTSGDYSSGVVAWSVGGGGGTGGDFVAILGGSGSNGGDGGVSGNVTVNNNGKIITNGERAFGIDAQSNAGGGGAGGVADGLIVEIGGDGGIGGGAGGVAINNAGAITTTGSGAVGIGAQSNGGGGGNAGGAGGIIAIGGNPDQNDDGEGAKGGIINISNSGTVSTAGDGAPGILAQSIGGGGGKAEDSVKGIVSVGGNGEAAGDAGNVYFIADTQGTISTSGDFSYGINAQSIGGGGGDGGSTVGFSLLEGVTVGGQGGAAGDGGYVQFDVSGKERTTITTTGDNAHGILAQSIGGGGGSAGSAISAGLEIVEIVSGGAGASGGKGGLIDFDWSNLSVTTSGAASRGIMLQSLGGGGGTGGGVRGDDASVLGQATVLVGGKGGNGGNGGQINATLSSSSIATGQVASSKAATTDDDGTGDTDTDPAITTDSSAISLQSIGGGGGAGGSVTNQTLNYGAPMFAGGAMTASVNVAVGGSGGGGGDGGQVSLTVSDSYAGTTGQFAHGIYLQSIGGGGGDGGSADNYMFQLDTGDVSVGFESGVTVGGQCIEATNGCGGGKGGDVTLSMGASGSSGNTVLNTQGDYGNGVLAQSIGGGGGDGGTADSYAFTFQTGITASLAATASVGGKGGSGGDGGQVTINAGPASQITTGGSGARGIVAQSIGGGGGTGQGTSAYVSWGDQVTKALSLALTADVGVGMSGGSGGQGGDVTVNHSGTITTTGRDSDGILAQSVGGGGGIGGSMGADQGDMLDVISNALQTFKDHISLTDLSIEAQVNVGGTGGSGGDGGSATVNHSGAIHTSGDYADAIVVQSIGGGGGTGGASTSETYVDWFDANVSVGGSGGIGGQGGAARRSICKTARKSARRAIKPTVFWRTPSVAVAVRGAMARWPPKDVSKSARAWVVAVAKATTAARSPLPLKRTTGYRRSATHLMRSPCNPSAVVAASAD